MMIIFLVVRLFSILALNKAKVANGNKLGIKQFEWPLINFTLWIAILAFISAIFLNFLVPEYDQRSTYLYLVGLVIIVAMKLLFKNDKLYQILKITLIASLWITFNASWYFNHGFTRSVIIMFAFFFTFIVLVQNNKGIIVSSILMALNLGALLLIQANNPELFDGSGTIQQTKIDIFYTLVIGWMLLPAYVYLAKRKYLKEYQNARKSEELKSAFLANMSHEIRTPLNAITGFSELIKEDPSLRNNEQYLDIIHSNSLYLNDLIDQVLNISLIESGNVKIIKTTISVKKLIDRLHKEAGQQLASVGKHKVRVKKSISDNELKIFTDRTQLEQLLKNLITNAVKFTKSGTIEIKVTQDQKNCYFSIIDSGKGIAEKDLPTIFDRFVKLSDHNYAKSRGVGLGLYLCKRIINQLDGTIHVESELGKGTTFTFTIPL